MKNISIIISILAFFIGGAAYAQNTVSGTIRDPKGEAVIGAAVLLDGSSSIGTTTDLDGKYTLTIPSGAKSPVLKIASIGFISKSEPVSGRAVIDIILEEDRELLDEAVVVGYGSMRRSDLTGSVASVKAADVVKSPGSSIEKMLQGRVAGLTVIDASNDSPESSVTMRVRGMSSINGSNAPLVVIDGVPFGDAGNLSAVNPNIIESIEVLKDASATAIYGSRGANGVILITTKSGQKSHVSV